MSKKAGGEFQLATAVSDNLIIIIFIFFINIINYTPFLEGSSILEKKFWGSGFPSSQKKNFFVFRHFSLTFFVSKIFGAEYLKYKKLGSRRKIKGNIFA